jgi:hypothetical protein
MSDLQEIGASLGFEPWTEAHGNLIVRLDGLISGASALAYEDAIVRQIDDVVFVVAHVSYRRQAGENSYVTVRETVVLLEMPGITFPHLGIQPRTFGSWLLEKAAGMAGLEELDFAGHAEYDKIYSTFTYMPDAVRKLMDDELLTYLTERPGLKVQTSDDRVLVCRSGKLLAADELTALIDDAQGLLSRLAQSTRRILDEGWNPTEAATHLQQNIGGMLGRMLKGRIVTREQAQEFVATPPPRVVPGNINKAFLGFSGGLKIALSIMAASAGFISGVVVFVGLVAKLSPLQVMAVTLIPLLALVGIGIGLRYASRFHKSRQRILTNGEQVPAVIVAITDSNVTINNQQRFNVELEYRAGGETQRKTVAAYGQGVQLAQSLLQSGVETEVLVDPEDPKSVIWVGQLVNWGS